MSNEIEESKSIQKKWFIPLAFILIGISLIVPLGIQSFMLWITQYQPLERLMVIGSFSLVFGLILGWAMVMNHDNKGG